MKTLILTMLLCVVTGCGGSSGAHRAATNYDSIRNFAKSAKAQEEASFRVTIAQETVTHKAEQAKYNDMIKNPQKYADVVDLTTGQNIPDPAPQVSPTSKFNDNTPEQFNISARGNKFILRR